MTWVDRRRKQQTKQTRHSTIKKEINTFAVVTYQDEYYPGIIESFTEEGAVVSAMLKMPKENWRWPE